jgi:hypothetical protein
MRVQVIDAQGEPRKLLSGIENTEAEFKEYINKITGKPDPMIVYAPGRFVHMSTIILRFNFQVQNIKTGEIINIPDLNDFSGATIQVSELPE